jgi:dipeptidyl aminopeptidase/acylaminoacyl peptidase
VLEPNFRGPSDHPQGCGSQVAQQDILDAVAFVRARYTVDEKRIYVIGYSGGGFMTLLMASRHPDVWAGASAWAGITDLAAWYVETPHDDIRVQLRGCFGGAPEAADLKAKYLERSPISYLTPSLKVPIDIAHGDHDPQVAVSHALRAFDLLAPGAVPSAQREQLWSGRGAPTGETDLLIKPAILLRRNAGMFRLTIYDGGHGYYPLAGIAWLAKQRRP